MSQLDKDLDEDLREAREIWRFCHKCNSMKRFIPIVQLSRVTEVCSTCIYMGKVEEIQKPVYRLRKRPPNGK
jgi:hypothetical protein